MNTLLLELVDLIGRGILLLGVAYIGSFAIRRRSAALVSCYWRVAIVAALLLPLVPTFWTIRQTVAAEEVVAPVVESLAPSVAVVAAPPEVAEVARDPEPMPLSQSPLASVAVTRPETVTRSSSSSWFAIVVLSLWSLGVSMVAGRWLVGALRFRRLCREATPTGDAALTAQFRSLASEVGLRRCPKLRTHPGITIPMAGGLLRAHVLLPLDCARWPEADRGMVLTHELVHVRRRDALFHLFSACTKAVHLINPFAWIAARSMRDAAERATDDRVLEREGAATNYARLLVEFASMQMATPCPVAPAGASSMAQPATVESRVHRILDPERNRSRPGRFAVLGLAGCFATLLAGIGGSAFADRAEGDAVEAPADGAGVLGIQGQLDTIVLPSVRFDAATLAEAVEYCSSMSREHDPDGRGVNIIVAPWMPRAEGETPEPTIDLELNEIPLGEVLAYIAKLSGRTFDIEPHSVVFRAGDSYELDTRTFELGADLMARAMKPFEEWARYGSADDPFAAAGDFDHGEGEDFEVTARVWLSEAGVSFPDGTSAFYEPIGSKLIVRNTRRNLRLIETIVGSMKGEFASKPPVRRAPIRQRMREQIVPSIEFQEASLDEAIDYLRSQSGEPPVNLVVVPRTSPHGSFPKEPRLTLQLRGVPFDAALKYVTEFAGMRYQIDPHAVVIKSAWEGHYDEGTFRTQTFPIANPNVRSHLSSESGESARHWLERLGVVHPDGAASYFDPIGNRLIVRNASDSLNLVRELIESVESGSASLPAKLGVPPDGALQPPLEIVPEVPTFLKLELDAMEGGRMKFATTELTAKAGQNVELKFSNPDVLPHNFLLLSPGSLDAVGAAADMMIAQPNAMELGFIPQQPSIKKHILVHSKLLQSGDTETLRFIAPKQPGDYPYTCTFPGHWRLMGGCCAWSLSRPFDLGR